jgi:uncharacterized protein
LQHPIVSVADILGRPGEYRDLDVRAGLPGVANALARLRDEPVRARLRAESVVEGVLVTGLVEGAAAYDCARCLTSHGTEVAVEVCELFAAPGAVGIEEDAYRIAGTDMDLKPMLRDAVALALPLRPLCRDDCKGLCARCGRDLNAGPCGCADDDIDPRWEALAALREQLAN